jgi:hypothetical protein
MSKIIPIPALTPSQSEHYRKNNPNSDPPPSAAARNFNTVNRWLPQWFENLRLNGRKITEGFEKGLYHDVSNIRTNKRISKRDFSQAIIVGSGPSANDLVSPYLQDFQGLILCGPSNSSLLAASGRPADIILAVDSAPETWMQLKNIPHKENGTLLITHPYIHPSILENWQGEVYFYRSNIPYGDHPFNSFVELLYPMVSSWMLQSGCTVNQEYSFLTYLSENAKPPYPTKKAYLCGVDFGYPKDPFKEGYIGRCATYRYVNGSYVKLPSSAPDSRSGYVTIRGTLTDHTQLGYKASLLYLYKNLKIPLYDCSNGVIRELPKYDISEVLKERGTNVKTQDPQEIEARYLWYRENSQEENPPLEEEPSDQEVLSRLQEDDTLS